MKRVLTAVSLFLSAACAHAQADAQSWLVSPAEAVSFGGAAAYAEPPALRPRGVVPVIDILRPEPAPDVKVKAPFGITVQFRSPADAAVEPATFKVFYGALKLDITGRITKFVTVTKEGFTLDNANIPVGRHRLTLQVQDNKQRMGERDLRFEVE
ncbi:MAG: hypothetical protein V4787_21295 [Pseudomonadota bacterium]